MRKGFTLIELLVSVTILVMITGIVYTSYRVGMRTYRSVEEANYFSQNMRQSWSKISRDLRCAYVSESDPSIKFLGEGAEGQSKVTFVTYSPAGLEEVSYYIDSDKDSNFRGLVREYKQFPQKSALEQSPEKQLIAPMAKSLSLRYSDGLNWKDTWGIDYSGRQGFTANTLPRAVEIRVTLADEKANTQKTFTTMAPVMSN